MTDIAASDVTLDIPGYAKDVVPDGPMNVCVAKVTFGDGALTYPTGGVPMPDKAKFGFRRAIICGAVFPPAASGYQYHYDEANHKIRIYDGGTELVGGTATPAAATMRLMLFGAA